MNSRVNSRKLKWSDIVDDIESQTEPIKPIKPIKPIEQIEPTEPTEPTEPIEKCDSNLMDCESFKNHKSTEYCDCDVCQIRCFSNNLYDITSTKKTMKVFFAEILKCFNDNVFVRTKIMSKVENERYKYLQILSNRRNIKEITRENYDLAKENNELTEQINIYKEHLNVLEERLIGLENMVKLSKGDKSQKATEINLTLRERQKLAKHLMKDRN